MQEKSALLPVEEYPPIPEERRAIYMEKIRDFTLMDDDFMSKVFEDKACAQYLLHILLEREDLTVVRDDTKLGRLMHDFHCKNVSDMTPSVLAERAEYFKE